MKPSYKRLIFSLLSLGPAASAFTARAMFLLFDSTRLIRFPAEALMVLVRNPALCYFSQRVKIPATG